MPHFRNCVILNIIMKSGITSLMRLLWYMKTYSNVNSCFLRMVLNNSARVSLIVTCRFFLLLVFLGCDSSVSILSAWSLGTSSGSPDNPPLSCPRTRIGSLSLFLPQTPERTVPAFLSSFNSEVVWYRQYLVMYRRTSASNLKVGADLNWILLFEHYRYWHNHPHSRKLPSRPRKNVSCLWNEKRA